jgi:predicted AAA+ superfamily ATPase
MIDRFINNLYIANMLFTRKILEKLRIHLETPEIVLVTGMRRVGKTTALRMIYDEIPSRNKVFIDIENPIDQRIFEENDFNNIWANLLVYGINNQEKAYLFLDEIQAMPSIVKAVKYLFDHYRVKFFLTGSSSFYLKNLFPESLSGRKILFELYPLDFEEFLLFKGQNKPYHNTFREKEKNKNPVLFEKFKKQYEEYLEFGGFPQVVLTTDYSEKILQIKDIFKSYFEKDVRAISDFKNIQNFRDLLLLLLQRTGSKLDVSKLASEIGISRDTVYSYLSFLQGTYVIDLIPPFTLNPDREVSGAKKIYFCDNGFLSHLGKVSEGALLENAVYLNIRKYGKVAFYQKRSGKEIDFILPDDRVALEVKRTGTADDYRRLSSLVKSIELREQYVITRQYKDLKGFIPSLDL